MNSRRSIVGVVGWRMASNCVGSPWRQLGSHWRLCRSLDCDRARLLVELPEAPGIINAVECHTCDINWQSAACTITAGGLYAGPKLSIVQLMLLKLSRLEYMTQLL